MVTRIIPSIRWWIWFVDILHGIFIIVFVIDVGLPSFAVPAMIAIMFVVFSLGLLWIFLWRNFLVSSTKLMCFVFLPFPYLIFISFHFPEKSLVSLRLSDELKYTFLEDWNRCPFAGESSFSLGLCVCACSLRILLTLLEVLLILSFQKIVEFLNYLDYFSIYSASFFSKSISPTFLPSWFYLYIAVEVNA